MIKKLSPDTLPPSPGAIAGIGRIVPVMCISGSLSTYVHGCLPTHGGQ